jgi:hypothetical protein
MKRIILILPILLLSGCTIPGIQLPFGPGTTAYENDVIIIKELTALPENVAPGQPTKLVAYVQNLGRETVKDIKIELYDYCSGQFENPKVTCPGETSGTSCKIQLLSGQIKEIEWSLTAAQLKLPSSCVMKVKASYNYKTQALSTIAFIDYTEYQRQLQEGKFTAIQPYTAQGWGPVKPILATLEQQPIPVQKDSKFTATFEIENKGSGFVVGNQIDSGKIAFSSQSDEGNEIAGKLQECKGKWGTIELVQQKSAKLICEGIPSPKVATETTITIITAIDYSYEFRKEVTVNIKPF